MSERLLTFKDVMRWTGLSKTQLRAEMRKASFPKQILRSEKDRGYLQDDVQNWILRRLEVSSR